MRIGLTVGEFGLATLFVVLFGRYGLPPWDPFRDTLLILPWIAASFRVIGRESRVVGGRKVDRVSANLEGLLLLILVLLTLARFRLGLMKTEMFLATGYLLLLAQHTGRLLIGLRPSLGVRLPRRPSVLFFFLPLVVYLALQPWMSNLRQPDGDEPYYLLLAHSIAYDLDVELTNNYAQEDWRHFMGRPIAPQPGDPQGPEGQVWSRHSALLPVLLAPAYRLGDQWSVEGEQSGRHSAMVLMALLTACLAWMVLRLGHHYSPKRPGAALLSYGIFAFSAPVLLYSYQFWVEIPAALLLAVALDRICLLRQGRESTVQESTVRESAAHESTGPATKIHRSGSLAVLALVVVLLPLLKLRLGLVSLSLLLLVGLRIKPQKRWLALLSLVFIGTLGGVFLYNSLVFDNPLKIHRWGELGTLMTHAPLDFIRGGLGIFYDVSFGLFGCAPIWLLLVPGLYLGIRDRTPVVVDLALVSLPYSVAFLPRHEWFGGWAPPFRYPFLFLPLLALLLVPVLDQRSRPALRWAITALGVVTAALLVLWVLIPGWTYNFAHGRSHLLDEISLRLGADFARFFPSAVRLRMATWIWPLFSLLLIPMVARVPKLPRKRRAVSFSALTFLLLGSVGLLQLTSSLTTRIVEVEDVYLQKQGGWLYPGPWTMGRPTYRGGWFFPAGSEMQAPVVAGGSEVTLRFTSRAFGKEPMRFEIFAEDVLLAQRIVTDQQWSDQVWGPFSWPENADSLIVRVTGTEPPLTIGSSLEEEISPAIGATSSNGVQPPREGALIDRVEFRWADSR